jgi:hypothetical protein
MQKMQHAMSPAGPLNLNINSSTKSKFTKFQNVDSMSQFQDAGGNNLRSQNLGINKKQNRPMTSKVRGLGDLNREHPQVNVSSNILAQGIQLNSQEVLAPIVIGSQIKPKQVIRPLTAKTTKNHGLVNTQQPIIENIREMINDDSESNFNRYKNYVPPQEALQTIAPKEQEGDANK